MYCADWPAAFARAVRRYWNSKRGTPATPLRNWRPISKSQPGYLEYFAGLGCELKGQTVPATAQGLHFTLREPYGVVARIVPFNHPFMFAAAHLAAPLMAGNAVVVKTPETSPLSGSLLGELCRDHLPRGLVNIVHGRGKPAGDALVRHKLIRRIGFTGSVPTGLAIQQAAAASGVKHVSLELGGKNPFIVFPDADLEVVVKFAVNGMNFSWAGQSCGSTSRLLLHESVHDEVVQRVSEGMRALRLGSPLDPDRGDGSGEFGAAVRTRARLYCDRAHSAAHGWSQAERVLQAPNSSKDIGSSQHCSPMSGPTCSWRAKKCSVRSWRP